MGGNLHLEQVLVTERSLEACNQHGAFRWDPRVKVALVLVVAALNVWLAIPWLSGMLLAAGLLLLCWSRPALRPAGVFLLVPIWPTAVSVVGYAVGFGVTPLAAFHKLTLYREGLLLGCALAVRVYCDITWLALLTLTTPFAAVLGALRQLWVPAILVDTLAMMYRYSFLLAEEFTRMRVASQSRGGRSGWMNELKTTGRIAAQIFMRAFDRSERIYWAMFARGGQ